MKEKVTTIKVKENVCQKFKKEKEELENRFKKKLLEKPKNKLVTELKIEIKCEFCHFCTRSGVTILSHSDEKLQ